MQDLKPCPLTGGSASGFGGVGQVISSTLNLDEVLNLVVSSAVAASPAAQRGSLHLYDDRTGLLRIAASGGL